MALPLNSSPSADVCQRLIFFGQILIREMALPFNISPSADMGQSLKACAKLCVYFLLRLALVTLASLLLVLQIKDLQANKESGFFSVIVPNVIFFCANSLLLVTSVSKWTADATRRVLVWSLVYCSALIVDLIFLMLVNQRYLALCLHSPATSETVVRFLASQFKIVDPMAGHLIAAIVSATVAYVVAAMCIVLPTQEERAPRVTSSTQNDPPPSYDPPKYTSVVDVRA